MGGAGAVVAKARDSFAMGDLRWVAEVLNHVVFAEPDHVEAKLLLANTYEQLGYGCENGTWRSVYLSGAYELRHGSFGTPVQSASADMVAQLPPEMLFDALAIRVDGPRAWDEKLTIDIRFTDTDEFHRLRLANGVLTHSPAEKADAAELTVSCPRGALPALALGQLGADDLAEAGVELHGDASALARSWTPRTRTSPSSPRTETGPRIPAARARVPGSRDRHASPAPMMALVDWSDNLHQTT
jgi:alkyl sulfatase BDS1-like metallo-beta-lactamase superfamily hydrolase